MINSPYSNIIHFFPTHKNPLPFNTKTLNPNQRITERPDLIIRIKHNKRFINTNQSDNPQHTRPLIQSSLNLDEQMRRTMRIQDRERQFFTLKTIVLKTRTPPMTPARMAGGPVRRLHFLWIIVSLLLFLPLSAAISGFFSLLQLFSGCSAFEFRSMAKSITRKTVGLESVGPSRSREVLGPFKKLDTFGPITHNVQKFSSRVEFFFFREKGRVI